ncbi:leucine-rich repeat domain-containing protein [Ruminococcus flavefaciens]|uniref:leucine-rich repeat domain-containing protein n=1 Tax=Ruminococcus flavefaciens TaxID=1265 RepID=UPI0026EA404C|nr:leucine-rich repeat domain-containing protein [Ruminococcus flavefaciens]
MKNFWKKTASGLLALLIVAGASPAAAVIKSFESSALTAHAEGSIEEDYNFTVNEDGSTVTITKWTGSGSEIEVPETLDGKTVTVIGTWAFAQIESITKVTLPDTVTEIGDSAFNGCTALADVVLPSGLKKIGSTAFGSCGITEITIPDGVESIGSNAFSSCAQLADVTIPASVTTIGESAFRDTAWLNAKKAEDPIVIVNNIIIDGSACTGSVTIPESVVCIGDMAFSNCRAMTSVYVPSNVKTIGAGSFSNCTSLKEITMEDGIESIGYQAFYACSALTRVTVPDSVDTIGGSAFTICEKLEYVKLPEGLTAISNSMFSSCSALKYVNIPDSVRTIDMRAFGGCTSLTKVVIPEGVKSIGMMAFMQCTGLKTVYVPESVTTIAPMAFSVCPELVVKGEAGSYAAEYANRNSVNFIDTETADAEINGVSLSLSDDLGLNFVVGAATAENKDNYSIKLSGECAEDGKTLSLTAKTVGGETVYCATASLTANNMQELITAELYKGDVLIDTVKYDIRSYLKEISEKRSAEGASAAELDMYASALTYGYAAENYFNGASNDLSSLDTAGAVVKSQKNIDDLYTVQNTSQYYTSNPLYRHDNEDAKFTLILDSKMAVRVYVKGMAAGTNDLTGKLTSVAGTKGGADYPSYFEIKDLSPLELGKDQTIKAGGKTYQFCPLVWAYRMLSNSNADVKNRRMAEAVANYAYAAYRYKNA